MTDLPKFRIHPDGHLVGRHEAGTILPAHWCEWSPDGEYWGDGEEYTDDQVQDWQSLVPVLTLTDAPRVKLSPSGELYVRPSYSFVWTEWSASGSRHTEGPTFTDEQVADWPEYVLTGRP